MTLETGPEQISRVLVQEYLAKAVLHRSGLALDVGCGTGRESLYLAQQGFVVDAIDKNEANLAIATKEAKAHDLPIRFVQADIGSFEITADYDVVVAKNSLHFLEKERAAAVLAKLQQKTKEGGVHILSLWSDQNAPDPHGRTPFSRLEIDQMYAGWIVCGSEVSSVDGAQHFYITQAYKRVSMTPQQHLAYQRDQRGW